jgi:hypothetical protein
LASIFTISLCPSLSLSFSIYLYLFLSLIEGTALSIATLCGGSGGVLGYDIYGGTAYPLRSWLNVGFQNPENEDQERFNTHESKARVIIDRALGKLKSQWRCLHNGIKTWDPQFWKGIILCCCTLHNVTIEVSGSGWDWDGRKIYVRCFG